MLKKILQFTLTAIFTLSIIAVTPIIVSAIDHVWEDEKTVEENVANEIARFNASNADVDGTALTTQFDAVIFYNTITVTGSVTDSVTTFELNLSEEWRVEWDATLTSSSGLYGDAAVKITGGANIELFSGSSIAANGDNKNALFASGDVTLTNGSNVSANGDYSCAIIAHGSVDIYSEATVTATGNSVAIKMVGEYYDGRYLMVADGAEVRSSGNFAIITPVTEPFIYGIVSGIDDNNGIQFYETIYDGDNFHIEIFGEITANNLVVDFVSEPESEYYSDTKYIIITGEIYLHNGYIIVEIRGDGDAIVDWQAYVTSDINYHDVLHVFGSGTFMLNNTTIDAAGANVALAAYSFGANPLNVEVNNSNINVSGDYSAAISCYNFSDITSTLPLTELISTD